MLPALEAPAFLGLVPPGELILLLGEVLAQQGRVPLGAALAVGVAAARPATQPRGRPAHRGRATPPVGRRQVQLSAAPRL